MSTSISNSSDYSSTIGSSEDPPLIEACRKGDLGAVQELYTLPWHLQVTDFYGNTPLIMAAKKGHHAIVEYLINKKGSYFEVPEMRQVFKYAVEQNFPKEILSSLIDLKWAKPSDVRKIFWQNTDIFLSNDRCKSLLEEKILQKPKFFRPHLDTTVSTEPMTNAQFISAGERISDKPILPKIALHSGESSTLPTSPKIPNIRSKAELDYVVRELAKEKVFGWGCSKDGCYARSRLVIHYLLLMGIPKEDIDQIYTFPRTKGQGIGWGYHVAPRVRIGENYWIIDPAIDPNKALTLPQWMNWQSPDQLLREKDIEFLGRMALNTTITPSQKLTAFTGSLDAQLTSSFTLSSKEHTANSELTTMYSWYQQRWAYDMLQAIQKK